jgi:formiminotetrahydrofolate cyclodeaminase
VEPFVEQLAAPTAAPGGGSASAAAGAMAAGLAAMVAGMSRGKKAYAQYEREHSAALARLNTLREELKSAIDKDSDSYKAVVAAYKATKENPAAASEIGKANRGATEVPLGVARMAKEVHRIAVELGPITNPKMASDLKVATLLANAAVEGALANVEINLTSFEDGQEAEFVAATRREVSTLRK